MRVLCVNGCGFERMSYEEGETNTFANKEFSQISHGVERV